MTYANEQTPPADKGRLEAPVRPGAEASLRDAVLTLNHLWNTSQDEAAIANQLDLCRQLAKYIPQGDHFTRADPAGACPVERSVRPLVPKRKDRHERD